MKTLDEVEARIIVNAANTPGDATNSFIIGQPGSYYLTGNITGTTGRNGISIQANDVTLDLNGFAVIGGASKLRGIDVPLPQSGLCIHDGSVRGWSGGGVQAATAVTLAERLRLTDNAGPAGLSVGNGSMVKDCVASANVVGFRLPDRSQISDCIASVNLGDGFVCTSFVSVIDCTSSRNGGSGFVTGASCSLTRCTATRNIPSGHGISAGSGCSVVDCIASSNGADGISVDSGGMVRGCNASANGNAGISAHNGNCYLVGNLSEVNQSVGIITQGPRGDANRTDGNSCNRNASHGFIVQGDSGNLIIRNSASGNGPSGKRTTNAYAIPIFNATGPIVDTQSNSTIQSNSPWANFIH